MHAEHRAILAALTDRGPGLAAAAVRLHLAAVERRLAECLAAEDRAFPGFKAGDGDC